MTDQEASELKTRVATLEERADAQDTKIEALEARADALEVAVEVIETNANAEPKAIGEEKVVPDSETFRYHKDHPKGKKFKTSEIGKLGKGWVDSPAKLK